MTEDCLDILRKMTEGYRLRAFRMSMQPILIADGRGVSVLHEVELYDVAWLELHKYIVGCSITQKGKDAVSQALVEEKK